jgi:hypothetical protein
MPNVVALGRLTEVRAEQELNALLPIVVTFGRLTDVRLVQELNAEVESVLIFAPPLTFVISDPWNIVPNLATGKPSNISGITTAFGPVYPVSVIFVPSLVHVQ